MDRVLESPAIVALVNNIRSLMQTYLSEVQYDAFIAQLTPLIEKDTYLTRPSKVDFPSEAEA